MSGLEPKWSVDGYAPSWAIGADRAAGRHMADCRCGHAGGLHVVHPDGHVKSCDAGGCPCDLYEAASPGSLSVVDYYGLPRALLAP